MKPVQALVLATIAEILLALALTACGGSDSETSDDTWIAWSDNASGEIVRDSTGEAFKVRRSDGAVVAMAKMEALFGYRVDSGGVLYIAVKRLGHIETTTQSDGSASSVFRCNNGEVIDLYDTPNGYRWSC